jgi:hypothetical protein
MLALGYLKKTFRALLPKVLTLKLLRLQPLLGLLGPTKENSRQICRL